MVSRTPLRIAGAAVDTWRRTYRTARAISKADRTPVGQTPREEIWALNKMRLYRYTPTRPPEERHPVPLLLVFAIITKPFIMDLRPGHSFIEYLLDRGFDVYLIDWGNPGPEDSTITMDDYGAEFLPRVIRRVQRDSGTDELSVLGYCFGSLVTLLYAALNPDGPAKNLILLTPPVDMGQREGSKFSVWLDSRWFDVDRFVVATGNLSQAVIISGAKMLKVVANYVGAYTMLYDRIYDEEKVTNWQAMHRWVHEGVELPAEAFRQWVRDYLWANAMVSGEHVVKGETVDLSRINVPVLNVLAELDHIVPPRQSIGVADLLGSNDVHTEVLKAGHVGIMSGRSANKHLWPLLADWLAERSGEPAVS